MTLSEAADEIEHRRIEELGDRLVAKSALHFLAEGVRPHDGQMASSQSGKQVLMGEDPRLPPLPEKPTLRDFFERRFTRGGEAHLLQSARLARDNGMPEHIVLACLLHDIAVIGFIRADHGYWGAQLLEPYVDEEVSWAIRMHQALRFFPDDSVGYTYPEAYEKLFGAGYRPAPYIVADYERARKHKWYMTARMITVNDLYAFDPGVDVAWDEFEDVVGRHFKQPAEGLGNDNTPSSHMWRTLRRPANAL
jgi:hypothetical protein